MNAGNIKLIAHYEWKLLRRNKLLLFFSLLVFLGVPFLQYYMQGRLFFYHLYILPCSFPLAHSFLFNIFQSVIVIWIAGEFCGKERRLDTLQAIRTRAYGNGEYIAGKYIAIVLYVSALDILTLIPLVVYHGFSGLPFAVAPYVFYFVTLVFPSLVFLTALTMWVNTLIKKSFLSLVVLAGFLVADLFFLSGKMNGLWEYRAASIPNVFSEYTGHVGLTPYLQQRLFVGLAGLAFLFLTAGFFCRLSSSLHGRLKWKIAGGAVLLLAVGTATVYYGHFYRQKQNRQYYIALYEKYKEWPQVQVLHQVLDYCWQERWMEVTDTIGLGNAGNENINGILLYLNPGLTVKEVKSEGRQVDFRREGQVLMLSDTLPVAGQREYRICYTGFIEEDICYLDIEDSVYYNTAFSNSFLRYGKHNACVSERFTFLTPECLWYPVSAPPVNPAAFSRSGKDLASFRLTVFHDSSLTAISQGESLRSDSCTTFFPSHPLSGLTLCIGDYHSHCGMVDSVRYEIYFFDPQRNFYLMQGMSPEGITVGIQRGMQEWEEMYGRSYPFHKFALVELPVSVSTYLRKWKDGSEFVQPELVFQSENWCKEGNFSSYQDLKDLLKSLDVVWTETEMGAKHMEKISCYLGNYSLRLPPLNVADWLDDRKWVFRRVENEGSLASLFTDFTGGIYADEFPELNKVINNWKIQDLPYNWKSAGAPPFYKAAIYLSSHSLYEALKDPAAVSLRSDILSLKSLYFQKYLYSFIPRHRYENFLQGLKERFLFQNISFRQYVEEFQRVFDFDVAALIRKVYQQRGLPTLLVRHIQLGYAAGGEGAVMSFDVGNLSESEGVITCYTQVAEEEKEKEVESMVLAAGECARFFVPIPSGVNEVIVHTNLSANLPGTYVKWFRSEEDTINYTEKRIPLDAAAFGVPPGEIIVDNEDEGFRITEAKARGTLLGKALHRKLPEYGESLDFLKRDFTGWLPSLYVGAYGERKRSFYGKRVGNSSSKAEWNAVLPEDGEYEVFVYQLQLHVNYQMADGSVCYFYTLEQGDFKGDIQMRVRVFFREVTLKDNTGFEDEYTMWMPQKGGWISVGTYRLSAGQVKLTLHDRGIPGKLIFADAVKWKKCR